MRLIRVDAQEYAMRRRSTFSDGVHRPVPVGTAIESLLPREARKAAVDVECEARCYDGGGRRDAAEEL